MRAPRRHDLIPRVLDTWGIFSESNKRENCAVSGQLCGWTLNIPAKVVGDPAPELRCINVRRQRIEPMI
jgi:hypothetical protein